jgi:hypothetical protein
MATCPWGDPMDRLGGPNLITVVVRTQVRNDLASRRAKPPSNPTASE